jgi:hypothetical protein
MIESKYWKKDLLNYSKDLRKQKEVKRWTEKKQVLFEKGVILNFFIIRKLIEVNKISTSLKNKKYNLYAYRKNAEKLTSLNSVWIDEHYDVDIQESKLKNITFICNQLIHSLTIFAQLKQKKWNSVLMCSDFEKNKWLYEIEIATIIEIMEDFGNNYPTKIQYIFNSSKNDYTILIE